mgnify:FL=1
MIYLFYSKILGSPEKVTTEELGTLQDPRLALSIKCPALPEVKYLIIVEIAKKLHRFSNTQVKTI